MLYLRPLYKILLACLTCTCLLILPDACQIDNGNAGVAADRPVRAVNVVTAWKVQVQPVSSISIAPDSSVFATVDPGGKITRRDMTGKAIWERKVENATNVVVSAEGEMIAAFSRLNPADTTVTVLSPDGSVRIRQKLSGAIWCAAVAPKEPIFAFGTGDGRVYVFNVEKERWRYTRWKVEGVITSLDFFPDGEKVAFGTWQDSVFGVAELGGKKIWEQPGDPDKLYYVQVGAGGKDVIVVGTPNRRLPIAELSLYAADNHLLWTRSVDGLDVATDLSGASNYAAVSYKKTIEHKGKDAPARYVTLINSKGEEVWEKGGLFFKPRLSVLSRDGVLVYDEHALYGLDLSGKVSSMLKMPATVRLCQSDLLGKRTLVYCGDGHLYCIVMEPK